VLLLVALSALPNPVQTLRIARARVIRRMRIVAVTMIALCVSVPALTVLLMSRLGLPGAGLMWLAGQTLVAVGGAAAWRHRPPSGSRHDPVPGHGAHPPLRRPGEQGRPSPAARPRSGPACLAARTQPARASKSVVRRLTPFAAVTAQRAPVNPARDEEDRMRLTDGRVVRFCDRPHIGNTGWLIPALATVIAHLAPAEPRQGPDHG